LCLFLAVTAAAFAGRYRDAQGAHLDVGHKSVVAARVNVIGSDNAFYEPDPARNALAEFSLKRKGNRPMWARCAIRIVLLHGRQF